MNRLELNLIGKFTVDNNINPESYILIEKSKIYILPNYTDYAIIC